MLTPYTGTNRRVISARREQEYSPDRLEELKRRRAKILSSTLKNGAAWEREATLLTSLMSKLDRAESKAEFDKTVRKFCFDSESPFVESVCQVRTPSSMPKFQGRKGAREIRKLEHLADESSRLTPEGPQHSEH